MLHDQLKDAFEIAKAIYSYKDCLDFTINDIPIVIKPALKHVTVIIKF